MEYPTVFDLIATEFKKAGIDYILIGGFAVNAYKYGRSTKDIDFMIAEEDGPKASEILQRAGFKEFHKNENFLRFDGGQRYGWIVDLVFTNRQTLSQLIEHGGTAQIVGQTIPVPSIEHLIAMKLHAIKQQPEKRRSKDLLDIAQLIEINKIDFKNPKFREFFLKFGTPELYKQIENL